MSLKDDVIESLPLTIIVLLAEFYFFLTQNLTISHTQ